MGTNRDWPNLTYAKEQTHLIFWWEIWECESIQEVMGKLTTRLCSVATQEWVKDKVKLISWDNEVWDPENVEDFKNRFKEIKNISKLQNKLYSKLFYDIEEQYTRDDGKILIQVPLSHAWDFIPQLIERRANINSKFSKLDIEYVIIDPESIQKIASNTQVVEALYEWYLDKIDQADRFIQIVDTARANATYVESEKEKKDLSTIASYYQGRLNTIWKERQNRLRLYFPTQEMAEKENMSLEEFYALYEKATRPDWNRMESANEQLADLMREYDTITIEGEWTDIEYDISEMWARNSVIKTNWPWSEVHTAPKREWVNGHITYNNEVYIKMLDVTIPGIRFDFSAWKLESFEILKEDGREDEIEEITENLTKLFDEEEGNRYLWELAFGTNFFVPTWIKHPLIWEKALGTHMAFGKSYEYKWVDNGNNTPWWIETSFHWDVIKDMKKDTVTFSKKSWESVVVMKNEKFNGEVLPQLAKYQEEIESLTL